MDVVGGVFAGTGLAVATGEGRGVGVGRGEGEVPVGVGVGVGAAGAAPGGADRVGAVRLGEDAARGLGLRLRLTAALLREGLGAGAVVAPAGLGESATIWAAAAPEPGATEDDAELPGRFRAAVEDGLPPLQPEAASRAPSSRGAATTRRSLRILHSVQVARSGVKADGEAMTFP